MYDINLKRVKKGKKIYRIFLAVGILFLSVAVLVAFVDIKKRNSMDSEVMSTNVSINSYVDDEGTTMYTRVYSYEVNGERYTCDSISSSNSNQSKENIMVKYNSKEPSSCMIPGDSFSFLFSAIFLLVSSIAIFIGVRGIKKVNKKIEAIHKLNTNGKLIKGIPCTIENSGISINDRAIPMVVINYTSPLNGEILRLCSEPIYDRINFAGISRADLLIDEMDPSSYYVDIAINRLSGNTPADYYKDPNANVNVAQTVPNTVIGADGNYIPQPIAFDPSVNTYKGPNDGNMM